MNVSGPEPVRTILLVEDDDQVRGMVRSLLRQNGYRVLEARSGGEGLRLAEAHGEAIDLLLCDMLLPEISGYDLAEKLHVRFPRMRMLFMTGYVEGEIV